MHVLAKDLADWKVLIYVRTEVHNDPSITNQYLIKDLNVGTNNHIGFSVIEVIGEFSPSLTS